MSDTVLGKGMGAGRCSRCGTEARANGSSWGKACLALGRKTARAAKNATPDATDATRAASHAACRRKIEALEGEVARLKKRLAESSREMVERMPSAEDSAAALVGRVEMIGGECVHGGVFGACRKLGCRPK